MGCEVCVCNAGLSNTGTACTPIMQKAEKIIVVPYYDKDGIINYIDLTTATFTPAYFSGLVNQSDKSKRWYPLPEVLNVEDTRADNKMEEFNDGSSVFISEGIRSFSGLLVKGTPQLKAKIEAIRCLPVGIFIVDKSGNLIGAYKSANKLYPIKLESASVSAKLVKTTDSTIQKLELHFTFHNDEKDEDLRMVACNEMSYDLHEITGLLDINATFSNITTTGFRVCLSTDYGTVLNPVMDEGMVIGDVDLYNNTDSAPVTPLTVVEDSNEPGCYNVTFAAQTSADVLFMTITRTGRDYTRVGDTEIVIP